MILWWCKYHFRKYSGVFLMIKTIEPIVYDDQKVSISQLKLLFDRNVSLEFRRFIIEFQDGELFDFGFRRYFALHHLDKFRQIMLKCWHIMWDIALALWRRFCSISVSTFIFKTRIPTAQLQKLAPHCPITNETFNPGSVNLCRRLSSIMNALRLMPKT